MIQIYHNPRCKKSREGVAFLESQQQHFEIINYFDTPLNHSDLNTIIKKLNIKPIELVRTNEVIWKSDFKGKPLADDAIIDAMVKYPKLIQRPIVVNNNNAVVARPTELILNLL